MSGGKAGRFPRKLLAINLLTNATFSQPSICSRTELFMLLLCMLFTQEERNMTYTSKIGLAVICLILFSVPAFADIEIGDLVLAYWQDDGMYY